MKCVLRLWGQLKRGFEVVALVEMCFEGMGAVEKGDFEVVAVGKKCFDGVGVVQKGVAGHGGRLNMF